MHDMVSIKVRREFLLWLKEKAAHRGCFMYELLEEFAMRSIGATPWAADAEPER